LNWTVTSRVKDGSHSVGDPFKDAARTGYARRSIVVYVEEVVLVDNKIWLLAGKDWATSESSTNVKSCCLSINGGIYNNVPNVIERTPITSEVVNVNLVVD
jgi:hypothetical protein